LARLLILLLFIWFLAEAVPSIKEHQHKEPPPDPSAKLVNSEIVSLPDGATLFAPDGTIGRTLADWLERHETSGRYFNLGDNQFIGETAEPTAESRGRVPRLVRQSPAKSGLSA